MLCKGTSSSFAACCFLREEKAPAHFMGTHCRKMWYIPGSGRGTCPGRRAPCRSSRSCSCSACTPSGCNHRASPPESCSRGRAWSSSRSGPSFGWSLSGVGVGRRGRGLSEERERASPSPKFSLFTASLVYSHWSTLDINSQTHARTHETTVSKTGSQPQGHEADTSYLEYMYRRRKAATS